MLSELATAKVIYLKNESVYIICLNLQIEDTFPIWLNFITLLD